MSSLTLKGATGEILVWARYAKPDEPHDIQFLKSRRFAIWGTVAIDEIQLRQGFTRIFACGPTQEDIDAGFRLPSKEMRRELGKCLPGVGFQLTGDVDSDAGFAISWDSGWVRGNAAGCLLPVHFVPNHERAIILRREIESVLDTDCRAEHIRGGNNDMHRRTRAKRFGNAESLWSNLLGANHGRDFHVDDWCEP